MLDSEIQSFITVVKCGSFTKAAEVSQVTKSRVSQQVTALEQRLGVTLLHRSTRKIRLTEQGESFFSECIRADAIMQNACQQLIEDSEQQKGSIRVNSVGGIFAEEFLAPAILEFMEHYQNIQVNLDLSSNRIDMLTENYDLAIRMGDLRDSALIARHLFKVEASLVASPAYLEKYGEPTHPKELSNHNCLCGSVNRWSFIHKENNEVEDILVSGQFISANGHILTRAALKGLGIVRLPNSYFESDLSEGKLKQVCTDWKIPSGQVSLVYPKVKYKVKRIQLLVDFLVDYFRS